MSTTLLDSSEAIQYEGPTFSNKKLEPVTRPKIMGV